MSSQMEQFFKVLLCLVMVALLIGIRRICIVILILDIACIRITCLVSILFCKFSINGILYIKFCIIGFQILLPNSD